MLHFRSKWEVLCAHKRTLVVLKELYVILRIELGLPIFFLASLPPFFSSISMAKTPRGMEGHNEL